MFVLTFPSLDDISTNKKFVKSFGKTAFFKAILTFWCVRIPQKSFDFLHSAILYVKIPICLIVMMYFDIKLRCGSSV